MAISIFSAEKREHVVKENEWNCKVHMGEKREKLGIYVLHKHSQFGALIEAVTKNMWLAAYRL